MSKYYIYVLLLNNNPVYVGLSTNVNNRISKHKKNKIFDSYVILRSFKDKERALNYEKGIIDFMTFFNKNSLNSTNNLIEFNSIKKLNNG